MIYIYTFFAGVCIKYCLIGWNFDMSVFMKKNR